MNKDLKEALINLQKAWYNVLELSEDNQEFNDKYPFDKSFLELYHDVIGWVDSEVSHERAD